MSSTFARKDKWVAFTEELRVIFDDGLRVIVKDQDGNIMFDGSRWLFDQCWIKGYFGE